MKKKSVVASLNLVTYFHWWVPLQAVKITPPTSAAALQPPVPRQSSGSVPSFSYNLISQPNVGSASGQQLQTGTVRPICFPFFFFCSSIYILMQFLCKRK